MMYLFHVTPAVNIPSIMKAGLVPKAAKGKLKVVWLCSASKLAWALKHLSEQKDCLISDFAVLPVAMHHKELTYRRRGIWHTSLHIPPERFFYQ